MAAEEVYLSTINIVKLDNPSSAQTAKMLWNAAGASIELHGVMVSAQVAGEIWFLEVGTIKIPRFYLDANDHEVIEFVHPLILGLGNSLRYSSTVAGNHTVMAWGEYVGDTTSTSTTTSTSSSTSTSTTTSTTSSTSTSTTTSTTSSTSTSTSTTTTTSTSSSTSTTTSTTSSTSSSTSTTTTSTSTSTTTSTSSTSTSSSSSTTTTLTLLVAASTGDCFVDLTQLKIDLDSTYCAFGRADPEGNQNVVHSGVRFTTVLIPQGTTIKSAVLTLVASDTVSSITVNAIIKGEDANQANAFSTYANFMGRPRTSASVAWNNIAGWTAGVSYQTADLKTIIQEIVNRAGWLSGNALVLFIENNGSTQGSYREFASWDHLTYAAAQLIVTW